MAVYLSEDEVMDALRKFEIPPGTSATYAGLTVHHAFAVFGAGTAVFAGMLAATIVNVVAVPMLYCVIQGMSERLRASPPARPSVK